MQNAKGYLSTQVLKKAFDEKMHLERGMSLRKTAIELGVSAGYLSLLLNGKKCATVRLAEKISERLFADPDARAEFLRLVDRDTNAVRAEKKISDSRRSEFYEVNAAQLEVVKNWEHMAVFALLETAGFKNDLNWMSQRLKLSSETVSSCLNRLEKIGLIRRSAKGIDIVHSQVTSPKDIPISAIRHALRQQILNAAESLEKVAMQRRDVSSFCFAFEEDRMDEAKTMIEGFRRKFVRRFSKNRPNQVYSLNIQFIPIT